MGLMFLFVVGATGGWLAAIVLRAESRSGLLRNTAAGIGGALFSGLLVSPLTGRGNLLADTYHVSALVLSVCGAIAAIAFVNLFKRVQVR